MKLTSLHYGLPVGSDHACSNTLVWQALYTGDIEVISVVDHDLEVFSLIEYGGIKWKIVSVDKKISCVQLIPVGISGR